MVPRLRKLRENADRAKVAAETADTKAKTAQRAVETITKEFEWYKGQVVYLVLQVDDLETNHGLMKGYMQYFRDHVNDLYKSIGQEDGATQERIRA